MSHHRRNCWQDRACITLEPACKLGMPVLVPPNPRRVCVADILWCGWSRIT